MVQVLAGLIDKKNRPNPRQAVAIISIRFFCFLLKDSILISLENLNLLDD